MLPGARTSVKNPSGRRHLVVIALAFSLAATVAIWHSGVNNHNPVALQAHFGIDIISGIDDKAESQKFEEYRFLGISSHKLKAWVGRLENRTAKLAHEIRKQHSFDSAVGKAVRSIASFLGRRGKLEREVSGGLMQSRQELSSDIANISTVEVRRLSTLPARIRSRLGPLLANYTSNSAQQDKILSAIRSGEISWNTSFWPELESRRSVADRLSAAADRELRNILAGNHNVFQDLVLDGAVRAAANISMAEAAARRRLIAAWNRFDAQDMQQLDAALDAVEERWVDDRRKLDVPAEAAAAEVGAHIAMRSALRENPHRCTPH